jgi:hypothetical protein
MKLRRFGLLKKPGGNGEIAFFQRSAIPDTMAGFPVMDERQPPGGQFKPTLYMF